MKLPALMLWPLPGLIRSRKMLEGKEYTTGEDFDLGVSVNVNHDDTNDQLQLDSKCKLQSSI
jgi:hypothetical protein